MAHSISEQFHLAVQKVKAKMSYKPKVTTAYNYEVLEMKTIEADHTEENAEHVDQVPQKEGWRERWTTKFSQFLEKAERAVLITAKVVLPPIAIACRFLWIATVALQLFKRR